MIFVIVTNQVSFLEHFVDFVDFNFQTNDMKSWLYLC